MTKVWPGNDYPLGATYDGAGTNFSIFSEIAERVELCLFDEKGNETRFDLPEVTQLIAGMAICLVRLGPGQRYGFIEYGPWLFASGRTSCIPAGKRFQGRPIHGAKSHGHWLIHLGRKGDGGGTMG